jgi:hypothetical protein
MGKKGGSTVVTLGLQLGLGPAGDEHQLDDMTRQLRAELLELDVEGVDLVDAGMALATAKGFGLVEVGGLIVKLGGGEVLRKVVETVRAWLARDANRSAKLVVSGNAIELTGLTAKQQQQLIETWIQQVAAGAGINNPASAESSPGRSNG